MCGRRPRDLASVGGVICPKCQNTMRTVDRQGIHIDQCEGCRGIFLDRGELESIMNAEQQYAAAAAPPPYQGDAGYRGAPPPPPGRYADSPRGYGRGGYADSPKGYGHGGYSDSPRGYHGGHGHRRRKSFLEGLFD
ncbi:MAG: zf-TFIIB domain-containing protein [Pseudonocardiaceae bacterium]|nr:zf-TFIIB domain-containing protein [Pseudonocardiaceae bacterium]